jgi:hypothetical protein
LLALLLLAVLLGALSLARQEVSLGAQRLVVWRQR